jgi:hypothetical protein
MLDMDLVGCSITECYVSQFVILDGKYLIVTISNSLSLFTSLGSSYFLMTKGRKFGWHYWVKSVPNSTEPVNPTASHIPALKEVSFNIHRKMAMCQSAEIKAESQGTMLLNSS